MEVPSSSRKRPLFDDNGDDDNVSKPKQKKVRFPKGKKVKPVTEPIISVNNRDEKEDVNDYSNPKFAAKERARVRSQATTKLFVEDEDGDISTAEVHYQGNESFVEDGIRLEPFNLEQEREEGFFDEAGNFVEYVREKEEKDAWLDSVDFDSNVAKRVPSVANNDDEVQDLSSDDVGKIKRRIADVLEPGETVLQALKRLKGHSNDKKTKMSPETKIIFDQLTEDAMKLMDNGEYNVYEEEREIFLREAEGYEAVARARNNVASADVDDTMDMFADEADDADAKPETLPSVPSEATSSWDGQSDYVYDESSGYYYSSSLGYYYDPSTGLFCCATSGQWYKYNEDSGSYDEVQAEPMTSNP